MILYVLLLAIIVGLSYLSFRLWQISPAYMLRYDVISHNNSRLVLKRYAKEAWVQVLSDGEDVTQKIIPYAGRDKNFYHIKTEINHVLRGHDNVTFVYGDGEKRYFKNYIEF